MFIIIISIYMHSEALIQLKKPSSNPTKMFVTKSITVVTFVKCFIHYHKLHKLAAQR